MTTNDEPAVDSRLSAQLIAEIIRMLHDDGLEAGDRLTERALAERLRVSRSPVRLALRQLHRDGYVDRTDSGRYVVARAARSIDSPPVRHHDDEEEVYLRIAADRLDGLLPEKVSEAYIGREYDLSRAQVTQLLTRMSSEGWVAQRPGKGWEFLPVLTSIKSYRDSYRFRLLVEPAVVLEPTFSVSRDLLELRRAEQQALVDGRIHEVSAPELFDLNSRFHEAITLSSGNDFFVEGLARINRLRRLVEYRQVLVPERAVIRCREHVALADLLLDGRLEEASAAMRAHLATVGEEKTRDSHLRDQR